MNHIHLSALMVRLAQLGDKASSGTKDSNASRSSSSSSASSSKRSHRAEMTAGQQLTAGHKGRSMAWAGDGGKPQAATAGNQLRAFLAQLVPHIGMQLLTFGPRQLSNVMWALGRWVVLRSVF
eukprot:1159239-Pelagomonas_calceolata.AAC.2